MWRSLAKTGHTNPNVLASLFGKRTEFIFKERRGVRLSFTVDEKLSLTFESLV